MCVIVQVGACLGMCMTFYMPGLVFVRVSVCVCVYTHVHSSMCVYVADDVYSCLLVTVFCKNAFMSILV